jgi:hypothetical protein
MKAIQLGDGTQNSIFSVQETVQVEFLSMNGHELEMNSPLWLSSQGLFNTAQTDGAKMHRVVSFHALLALWEQSWLLATMTSLGNYSENPQRP